MYSICIISISSQLFFLYLFFICQLFFIYSFMPIKLQRKLRMSLLSPTLQIFLFLQFQVSAFRTAPNTTVNHDLIATGFTRSSYNQCFNSTLFCFIKEELTTVTETLHLSPTNKLHAKHTHVTFSLPLTYWLRDTSLLSFRKKIFNTSQTSSTLVLLLLLFLNIYTKKKNHTCKL